MMVKLDVKMKPADDGGCIPALAGVLSGYFRCEQRGGRIGLV
jgi:hypothetical protein